MIKWIFTAIVGQAACESDDEELNEGQRNPNRQDKGKIGLDALLDRCVTIPLTTWDYVVFVARLVMQAT